MTTLVVLSVIDITLLIAGLAIYLYVVGGQLTRVADKLENAAQLVWKIKKNAEVIEPGLEQINNTGGITAGALPLLYGMAEDIVTGATFESPDPDAEPVPARPAMKTRRTRLAEAVGYDVG